MAKPTTRELSPDAIAMLQMAITTTLLHDDALVAEIEATGLTRTMAGDDEIEFAKARVTTLRNLLEVLDNAKRITVEL